MPLQYTFGLLIPFRSDQDNWNISYRHENWYHNTPHSTSDKISAYFGMFRPISAGTKFWLKFFFFSYLLLLVGFEPIFFFFVFQLCAVQVNSDVFACLSTSSLFLKCYVLCFKFFVCFASPCDTLLSCHLCFKI